MRENLKELNSNENFEEWKNHKNWIENYFHE